jgi:membrane protein
LRQIAESFGHTFAYNAPEDMPVRSIARAEVIDLLKTTAISWSRDKVPRLGASLAFYTMLSLAPMLVVVMSIAGMVFGKKAAEGQIVWQIQDLVGSQGATAIQNLLEDARRPSTGALATAVGLITLFLGATAVINELRDALNTIWQVKPPETQTTLRTVLVEVRNRLFSFAMVLGVGFFLLVSLAANAWVAAAGQYVTAFIQTPPWLLELINSTASFLVIAALFAILYKSIPAVRLEWSDVVVGALVTSALFTTGKFLIGVYLGRTTVASAYGAAGSLVVVLLWVYYSAQVFFLGAEFTCVYTYKFGSRFRRSLELKPKRDDQEAVIEVPGSDAAVSGAADRPGITIVESIKTEKG